jgi:hypothetical protein
MRMTENERLTFENNVKNLDDDNNYVMVVEGTTKLRFL